jgi:hypothetical protein
MDASQCWNDRPRFGVNSISQKLSAYNSFKHYKIKSLVFYNYNTVFRVIKL